MNNCKTKILLRYRVYTIACIANGIHSCYFAIFSIIYAQSFRQSLNKLWEIFFAKQYKKQFQFMQSIIKCKLVQTQNTREIVFKIMKCYEKLIPLSLKTIIVFFQFNCSRIS
jgi:hypothetical protein